MPIIAQNYVRNFCLKSLFFICLNVRLSYLGDLSEVKSQVPFFCIPDIQDYKILTYKDFNFIFSHQFLKLLICIQVVPELMGTTVRGDVICLDKLKTPYTSTQAVKRDRELPDCGENPLN